MIKSSYIKSSDTRWSLEITTCGSRVARTRFSKFMVLQDFITILMGKKPTSNSIYAIDFSNNEHMQYK